MSYAHDATAGPNACAGDFVGPLPLAHQQWLADALRTDNQAAESEPVDLVIRRREAHVASLYRMAGLLALTGDLAGAGAAGFRAVAESRALSEFLAAGPAYCLDCFVLGDRCQRHRSAETSGPGGDRVGDDGAGGDRAYQPDWRRFGAEEFPSE